MRAWPYLFLVLASVAFFAPALLEGRVLAPGDNFAQNLPLLALAARAYRAGEMPFWNPYMFGGMPLLASTISEVLFPGNAAFLVLPPVAAMDVSVMLAYSAAACGLYTFVRAIGCGRVAGLAGGLAFAFSGFMVAHIDHLNISQAAAILPWLLWMAERLRVTGDGRYAVGAAGLLGVQVLAGHPQMVVFSLLVCGAYTAFRGRGQGPRYALLVGGIVVLGLGLAAIQLLPTLAFIPRTQRAAISYGWLTLHSLPPRQLVSFLFPYYFGSGVPTPLFPTPYWGAGPYFQELGGYPGLVTLALAGVAVGAVRARDALARQTWFWAGVATCAVILAFGDYTPLYHLVAHLPVLSSLPHPGRHLLEVDLALAILGAIGLERLARRTDPRPVALAVAAPLGLVLVGVLAVTWVGRGAIAHHLQPYMHVDMFRALDLHQPAFWLPLVFWGAWVSLAALARPTRPWRLGLLALLVADLALFGQHYEWRMLSPVVSTRPTLEGPRFEPGGRKLGVSRAAFPFYDVNAIETLHIAPVAGLRGTRSISGYGPFISRRLATAMGVEGSLGFFYRPLPYEAPHHAFAILELSQLLLDPALGWTERLAPDRWVSEGGGRYHLRKVCPPAFRATGARVLAPAEVDRRVASDPGFDPCREALLEEGVLPASLSPGSATLERLGLNHLQVATTGAGPGLLVVSEGYDPGWHAFSGATPLPVRQANALVLGVEVPAGPQVVDLWYEPPGWRAGLAISGTSLLLLILGWLRLRRPEPAPAVPPGPGAP